MKFFIKKVFFVLLLVTLFASHAYAANFSWQNLGAGFSVSGLPNPSFAINPVSNQPYVAYEDSLSRLVVETYNGTSWVSVGSVPATTSSAVYPSIAFDPSGTPYVSYVNNFNTEVNVVKYNGTSWVSVGAADFSPTTAISSSLAIDSSGTPYVFYQQRTSPFGGTVMKYNGTSWVLVGSAQFTSTIANSPLISLDHTGVPYVEFVDNSNNISVMTFNGTSWINVGASGFVASVGSVTMTFDSSNNPYITYVDANTGQPGVLEYTGGSWQNLSSTGLPLTLANLSGIAIDSLNNIYIAYSDLSGKANVMEYNGSSWVYVGTAGIASNSSYLFLALSSSDAPYIAHDDSSGTQMDVQAYLPTLTLPPTLTAPTPGTHTDSIPLTITYSLPQTPTPGSVTLTLTPASGAPIVLNLADVSSSTFAITPTQGFSGISDIVSANGATSIPDGTYDVTLTYQDSAGDLPTSTTVSGVIIAPTDITSAGVTSLFAPATGTNSVISPNPADASKYTLTSIGVSPGDKPFKGSQVYQMTIVLTSNSGYEFPSGGIAVPTTDSTRVTAISSGVTTGTGSGNTLTFTVTFAPTTPLYDLEYTAGPNGTVTGTTSQSVLSGRDGTSVTAIPNAGYQFVNWTGTQTTTDNPLQNTNVASDISETANFSPISVPSAGASGGISGGSSIITWTPQAGFVHHDDGFTNSNSNAAGTTNFLFTKNLKKGMTDPDVAKLQHYLGAHGFLVTPQGKETTTFGPKTKKELALFQKSVGFTSDGVFGTFTRKYVNSHN